MPSQGTPPAIVLPWEFIHVDKKTKRVVYSLEEDNEILQGDYVSDDDEEDDDNYP